MMFLTEMKKVYIHEFETDDRDTSDIIGADTSSGDADEIEEANTTQEVGGEFQTPKAFGKKGKKDYEVFGYKTVKESSSYVKFIKLIHGL